MRAGNLEKIAEGNFSHYFECVVSRVETFKGKNPSVVFSENPSEGANKQINPIKASHNLFKFSHAGNFFSSVSSGEPSWKNLTPL